MTKEVEALVEYQATIGEANPGSYQPVRFSRIKYKKCAYTHIDIRRYRRGYDAEGEEAFYPTKTGFRFLESEFRRVVKEYTLTPETYLHPQIAKRCLPMLKTGPLESAVIEAFKLVEICVRNRSGAPGDEVGVRLLRRAFNPNTGPLTDLDLPMAEREAFANYLVGAYGFYRNPCSHRDVGVDFLSAFVRIVVASDLLWAVERAPLKPDVRRPERRPPDCEAGLCSSPCASSVAVGSPRKSANLRCSTPAQVSRSFQSPLKCRTVGGPSHLCRLLIA
jgi:uncharacterized protein (TIGR02391 family)